MMYHACMMMNKKPLTVAELASMGGKARAAKLSPEEQSRIGKNAVAAREVKRALEDAHMPTWMKATIMGLRAGKREAGSYYGLGRRIGASIDEYVMEDEEAGYKAFDDRFTDAEWSAIAKWDPYEGREGRYFVNDGVSPTGILQRIFASERHPDGNGDLVRQIPYGQRSNFLAGIIHGVAEDR